MHILKPALGDRSGVNKQHYKQYLETGSYRGFMIEAVLHEYASIHSMELSPKWHTYCKEKFRGHEHVHCYYGDSRLTWPAVLADVNEPASAFLDADYSGGTTARAEKDTPLLEQLDIVARSEFSDVVIVDDTVFFGQKGGTEPSSTVTDDDIWPPFAFDWSDTTEDAVRRRFEGHYQMVTNADNAFTSSPRQDQFILFPAGTS
jgi:hypothetical protein